MMESDAICLFEDRLRKCVGDDTVSSFARRCGLPEATIRSYLDGKKPVFDKLVKIADAAGVTVDWLATGRGPMRRADALNIESNQQDSASLDALTAPHAMRWRKLIELVEGMPEKEAAAFIEEAFARASQQAEVAELRQAVAELRAALKRA